MEDLYIYIYIHTSKDFNDKLPFSAYRVFSDMKICVMKSVLIVRGR